MPEEWDKLDRLQIPTMETIAAYVESPLWDVLHRHLEEEYQSRTAIEFSGCSMPGWNVKHKKAGRSLCTLYPMKGFFVALVVISDRERLETELALDGMTDYVRRLYRETKTGMGQKWLMPEVRTPEVLADVKQLISIRRAAGRSAKIQLEPQAFAKGENG